MPQDPTALDSFYTALSQGSFVLLGLWWVVAQLKYAGGAGDARRRRHVYGVTIFLLIPGVMAVTSLVNPEIGLIWRIAFGVTGLVGLVESVLYLTTGGLRTRGSTSLRVLTSVICGLIVLISIVPELPTSLGIGLTPREIEAILASLLLIVGAHMAYFALTEAPETAGA